MKTYIIARDEYMGVPPSMEQFEGTYRALLEYLTDYDDWKDDRIEPGELRPDVSDAGLEQMFLDGNGDGQQFIQVWCVDDRKQVLS